MTKMTFAEIEELAFRALTAAGTSEANARPLATATAWTELDGIASHGLAYIPIYCEHVDCGKVDGHAEPIVNKPAPGVVQVDAATGFAHSAINAGFDALIEAAEVNGIAAMAIRNSYNCGVLGYHTERIAKRRMLGIGFTNSPASIAPDGGTTPVLGTNPFSIAAPGDDEEPLILIDQSASVIAKSEVMKCAREGKSIPEGWALGPDGEATTDPNVGLKGSMAPAGGYKGVGVALMVELMAAAMTGATLGKDASPFSGTVGGPPKTGQFFVAINPIATSGGLFGDNVRNILDAMHAQDGVRVPGDGRKAARAKNQKQGVTVNPATVEKINAWL